jgi:hypothetical protein
VTAVNVNRRSIFDEAYLGGWEVLGLRILAAPVYIILFIILFGVSIWAVVGPSIWIKKRWRRRQVTNVLVRNGLDLTNKAVRTINEEVGEYGVDYIQVIIHQVNKAVTPPKSRDDIIDEKVSGEIVEKLLNNRTLRRTDKGELAMNPRVMLPGDLVPSYMLPGDIAPSTDEEQADDLVKSGILSKENGKLKCNETAVQALTVLAKAWGKEVPEITSD